MNLSFVAFIYVLNYQVTEQFLYKDYKLTEKLLGKGSFGKVFLAFSPSTFKRVAVKVIKKEGKTQEQVSDLLQEVIISKKLKHENIIRTYGY